MEIVILSVLNLLLLAVFLIFVFTHLRPLSSSEILQLGKQRRNKQVNQYFSFSNLEQSVDKNFKKRMKADGEFYGIKKSLFEFPSIAAAFLKYKKHEWIIVAFEKNKQIDLIWVNKGLDNSSVSLYLPIEMIMRIAQSEKHSSILFFHNHPNSNPQKYSLTRPSSTDINSAKAKSKVLSESGLNLIEAICERGRHYQYFRSIAENFLPLNEFAAFIKQENDQSKFINLSLHIERIFRLSLFKKARQKRTLSKKPQENQPAADIKDFAFGRTYEADIRREDIKRTIYSAVLDQNTCAVCSEMDGKTVPNDFPFPNPDCLHGDDCRCMGIYVLSGESEASV